MAKTNPKEVERALAGMEYPATKEELVIYARDNDVEELIIAQLESLPEQEYDSGADVAEAVGDGKNEKSKGTKDDDTAREEDDDEDEDD